MLKRIAEKLKAQSLTSKMLTLGQILIFLEICWTGRRLVRDLMYSLRQPDYLHYGAAFAVCAVLFVLLGILKRRTGKMNAQKSCHVEPMPDNAAYISGDYLVLEKDTGSGRQRMSFLITRIHGLRSGGGITSFMYDDPGVGLTEFSCKDDYEPKISALLRSKGVETG